jgi:chloride channel protein, CIC family
MSRSRFPPMNDERSAMPQSPKSPSDKIPTKLTSPGAVNFWMAVVLTGVATGLSAGALTKLLEFVQQLTWRGSGTDILDAAQHTGALRHIVVLAGAGIVIGLGQIILKQLTSGNGIDTTAAIWFHAGRMPVVRTLGSAILSVITVGMGVSLGREGAPKQAGSVAANLIADWRKLSDEQRRLLVACGAGAGMGSAYGVPLGGALFALEVMRGILALRFILPALVVSAVATGVSWLILPDEPTYHIPSYASTLPVLVWTLIAGPIAGVVSAGYVRLIRWADQNKPQGWQRVVAPAVVLGLLGVASIWFPELLGNGKDVSEMAFTGQVAPALLWTLFILKPAATSLCMRSGAPGGVFTPSLTMGAMLGGALGGLWSLVSPGAPLGLYSLLGAGAVIGATTQGPISAVVLLMELTGRDRSFILPLILIVWTATIVARTIEPRSIYDAKLSDQEIAEREKLRDRPATALSTD